MSRAPRGFSLVEVLFAMAITIAGVLSVAQLLATATYANNASRTTTMTAILAAGRMEQLRALTWSFDAWGLPVSDASTNLAVEPPAGTGGTGLTPSPEDALTRNPPGYFDWVDARGRSLGGAHDPPAGAVYTRRWLVTPLSTDPNHSLVLQVRVTSGRLSQEARLVSLRTRRAW